MQPATTAPLLDNVPAIETALTLMRAEAAVLRRMPTLNRAEALAVEAHVDYLEKLERVVATHAAAGKAAASFNRQVRAAEAVEAALDAVGDEDADGRQDEGLADARRCMEDMHEGLVARRMYEVLPAQREAEEARRDANAAHAAYAAQTRKAPRLFAL